MGKTFSNVCYSGGALQVTIERLREMPGKIVFLKYIFLPGARGLLRYRGPPGLCPPQGGSVAEWLACCRTQAQKGPGSNRSRDAVG